jgi:HAMP domain-containing protein
MRIESTYPNTKRAARARKAVDNALDVKGVADRQKKAVDDFDNLLAGADASPRSKAVLDFRVKADNFVLTSAALSDLKNLRKTVAAIRPVIRGRAAPVPAKETEELAANLEQLMRKSLDPSVSDAERADVLVQFYTELGDVANNVGADVLGVLDDKIAQMEKSVKGAKKDYNRQRRYMKRRNFWEPEFDEATKMMKDTLAALEEASEQYAGNRGMASLFRVLKSEQLGAPCHCSAGRPLCYGVLAHRQKPARFVQQSKGVVAGHYFAGHSPNGLYKCGRTAGVPRRRNQPQR